MTTDLDQLAKELQQLIIQEARKIYSDKVIEECNAPHNLGRMPNSNAHGLVHGWCGDTMEIYLRLNGEKIEQASFTTNGCGSTIACGSMLTRMVTGMSLEKASAVQPQDLLKALDGLPEENAHCATLAVNTLQNALSRARSAEPEMHIDN
jgi:nitrogen fixation NifU-like protein